jgi:hypothetical protein
MIVRQVCWLVARRGLKRDHAIQCNNDQRRSSTPPTRKQHELRSKRVIGLHPPRRIKDAPTVSGGTSSVHSRYTAYDELLWDAMYGPAEARTICHPPRPSTAAGARVGAGSCISMGGRYEVVPKCPGGGFGFLWGVVG